MLSSIFIALAQSDPLAELIRDTGELRSFTAIYEFTAPRETASGQFRIDYVAPTQVRVDQTLGKASTFMWCIDGVVAVTSTDGTKTYQGRADSAAVYESLAPLCKTLYDAFPPARPRGIPEACVGMGWSFDEKQQQANFAIVAQFKETRSTPLGWLETLREKHATAREDGELLRFETDGRFQIAISKQSGFLQEFAGIGPKGEVHIKLRSLEQEKGVDAARFAIPAMSGAAQDVSSDLSRTLLISAEADLRRRIYLAIAVGDATAPWDSAALARISSVWRPYYERTVIEALNSKSWFEKNRKIQDGIAQRLEGMRKTGKSPEEIEQSRQREIGYLNKQLDEREAELAESRSIPKDALELPRAAALLEQEKQVLRQVFDLQVRKPVLADFERLTKP